MVKEKVAKIENALTTRQELMKEQVHDHNIPFSFLRHGGGANRNWRSAVSQGGRARLPRWRQGRLARHGRISNAAVRTP